MSYVEWFVSHFEGLLKVAPSILIEFLSFMQAFLIVNVVLPYSRIIVQSAGAVEYTDRTSVEE